MSNQENINKAIKINNIKLVKKLLKESSVSPERENNHAFRLAARYGHTDIILLLLQDKRINPADLNNNAITVAFSNQYYSIVKALINNKLVSTELKNNKPELYKEITEKIFIDKISCF
jgi:ankyrin repeat protein